MKRFETWDREKEQSEEEMDNLANQVTSRFIRNNPEVVDEFLTKLIRSMTTEYDEDKEWDTSSDF